VIKLIYVEIYNTLSDIMKIHTVTISSKGQITLPKEFREHYHILEGEQAIVLPTEDGILIKHTNTSLRGALAGKIDLKGFENDIKKLRKEWSL